MEENEKYLATIPVYRRIDAVYVDFNENGEVIVFRCPVVGIKVTSIKEDYHHTYISYTPLIILNGDGTIKEMNISEDFLGLEFDGKQEDWSKEIAWRKEWRERELRMKVSREKDQKESELV